jgi:pimeloyl-ACP methyl ester carboxylesterase
LFEFELPAIKDWGFDEEKLEAFSRPVLHLRRSERSPEDSGIVQSWFPQTEERLVEVANHMLHMQDPQPVAEGIADFLSRQQS